ncbi:O-antigen ligase family protein [Undibacterium arcticum]|uniref:O-antigen ligase family protein n=1 Tax=Undibacterium arcticum TaxID=1762892 RepID=UPI003611287C
MLALSYNTIAPSLENDLRYLKWPVAITFLLYPAFALNLQGANVCFYLLVLFALVGLACRVKPLDKSFTLILREHWPVMLAMAGTAVAIFLHQLSDGQFSFKPYDLPSRLALFALIFWALLLVPGTAFRQIQWGLAVGTVIAAIKLYAESHAGELRPVDSFSTPLVPFGNLALLMGALALLSIGWNKPGDKISIAGKVIAGCAGLYASYLSQARGGWVAIPLFIFIAAALYSHLRTRYKLLTMTLLAALILAIGTHSTMVRNRIVAAETDIAGYIEGKNVNTSLGLRWQIWQASWLIFKEHPVVGIGQDRFPAAIQKLAEQHVMTAEAAIQPHSHNDIMYKMATFGTVGVLALLSVYFVPAFYFLRRMRDPDQETRTIASMGLALCLGFRVRHVRCHVFLVSKQYLLQCHAGRTVGPSDQAQSRTGAGSSIR